MKSYRLGMMRKKITTLLFILTISSVLSIGCGITRRMESEVPAQAVHDRIVTSAIKARLAKQTTSSTIDVETRDGNVTLSGTVANPEEGNRLIVSALSVDGVRSLRPNITVK